MFTREEISNFMRLRKLAPNYIEIECGCTVKQFGDAFGNLRVYADGRIKITCRCNSSCPKVNLSPVQFAGHLGKSTTIDKWKKDLWVLNNIGRKIKLGNTCLLRYHVQTFKRPRRYVHRDEFICCSKCNKERRFHRRTQEESRIYHRASLDRDWQCSNTPELNLNCDKAEERKCRKPNRGCPRITNCIGCKECVCTGCHLCRFQDCNCQLCVDHVQNEWHPKNN